VLCECFEENPWIGSVSDYSDAMEEA
jgi:hypothetical protein